MTWVSLLLGRLAMMTRSSCYHPNFLATIRLTLRRIHLLLHLPLQMRMEQRQLTMMMKLGLMRGH